MAKPGVSSAHADTGAQRLCEACAKVRALLGKVTGNLQEVVGDEQMAEWIPIEADYAIKSAIETLEEACRLLPTKAPPRVTASPGAPGGPTRQQGQFLAYIREYMRRNHLGVAPAHADLQWYFQLTAPSVNSMLIRLERRGFVRRVPHQARGIEGTVAPDLIPPLERPFKAPHR